MRNAANELLEYLYENGFCELPNYPFDKSFDEIILEEDIETIKKVEVYAKYCLANKEEIMKIND